MLSVIAGILVCMVVWLVREFLNAEEIPNDVVDEGGKWSGK